MCQLINFEDMILKYHKEIIILGWDETGIQIVL